MGNKLCTVTDADEVPDLADPCEAPASPAEAGGPDALPLAGVSAEPAPGPEPEPALDRFLQKADAGFAGFAGADAEFAGAADAGFAGADAEWVQVPRSPESETPEPEPPSIATNRREWPRTLKPF
jgi:hypothetical protein